VAAIDAEVGVARKDHGIRKHFRHADEARIGVRRVYFGASATGGGEWLGAPVWRREALLAGNAIAGPAVVEEVSATTVLYPGDRARVDAIGSLVVDMSA